MFRSTPQIFTFLCKLAKRCAGCGEKIERLKSPAFYLPLPYVNGHNTTFSVLVKPTDGSWHDCHENDADFHVGVSLGEDGSLEEEGIHGEVISYSSNGVIREGSGWQDSLLVFSITDPESRMMWGKELDKLSRSEKWSKYRYDESSFNCFDFALTLIDNVDKAVTSFFGESPKLLPYSGTREEMRMKFVRKHVMPKVKSAVNYHKLSVQVTRRGVVVLEEPEIYGVE